MGQLGVYYRGQSIGTITADESERFAFEYQPTWLDDRGGSTAIACCSPSDRRRARTS